MRAYGDYIRETKRILGSYNKMKVAVMNLTEEIEAIERLLQDEGIATVRYGDEVGRGAGELTATEAAAARRIRMRGRITEMRERRDEMERLVRKIDRALFSLDDGDAELVRGRYMQGRSWAEVAEQLNYTEKWAKEKGGKVLRDVALMLFGVGMRPVQLNLVYSCG